MLLWTKFSLFFRHMINPRKNRNFWGHFFTPHSARPTTCLNAGTTRNLFISTQETKKDPEFSCCQLQRLQKPTIRFASIKKVPPAKADLVSKVKFLPKLSHQNTLDRSCRRSPWRDVFDIAFDNFQWDPCPDPQCGGWGLRPSRRQPEMPLIQGERWTMIEAFSCKTWQKVRPERRDSVWMK